MYIINPVADNSLVKNYKGDHSVKPRLIIKAIAVIIALFSAAYVINVPVTTVDALSKYGSRGEEVKKIQQSLKKWGYYTGSVDGIYGTATKNAVIKFQKKNGLTPDGIAGPATLKAIGISSTTQSSQANKNNSDYKLLARIISAEARGEPYLGQVAVGAVVMNRVEHPSFPDSIAGVVYQPGAFTAINDGQINQPIADSAYRAATEALNGSDPSGGALYYYNPKKTSNKWIRSRPVIKAIGDHLFCS